MAEERWTLYRDTEGRYVARRDSEGFADLGWRARAYAAGDRAAVMAAKRLLSGDVERRKP